MRCAAVTNRARCIPSPTSRLALTRKGLIGRSRPAELDRDAADAANDVRKVVVRGVGRVSMTHLTPLTRLAMVSGFSLLGHGGG